ncbi:MAG: glycosyltransferase [Elusimicrobiota bacterium]|jgi:glycosyltransferase involved in cell wall biosynthesis|nr:glycosyltransferase [Elusimicrobiota bacterium]
MRIKNKLQIVLITYNREKYLTNTLEQLFANNSPIKDFDITVLDNNSTDNTGTIVNSYQKQHPNLKYHKNKFNLGLAGNISRAIEFANKEYHWVIADDDKYYWHNWSLLEAAINAGHDVICAAHYAIPKEKENDTVFALIQSTFISSFIFKTSILNDTVMANVMNTVYTLFPHVPLQVSALNNGKSIYVLPEAVVENGKNPGIDVSYTRGHKNDALYVRQRAMSWICGFANIISLLKDKKLKYKLMDEAVKKIHGSYLNFYNEMYNWYALHPETWMNLFDVLMALRFFKKVKLILYIITAPILSFYPTDKGLNIRIFGIKTRIIPRKILSFGKNN